MWSGDDWLSVEMWGAAGESEDGIAQAAPHSRCDGQWQADEGSGKHDLRGG